MSLPPSTAPEHLWCPQHRGNYLPRCKPEAEIVHIDSLSAVVCRLCVGFTWNCDESKANMKYAVCSRRLPAAPTWNLQKAVSKPRVEDLPCDIPAPTMAPLWIMGPSCPQGRPEDTEPNTANTWPRRCQQQTPVGDPGQEAECHILHQ